MNHDRVFAMPFASVYPHYVQKAQRKGRTQQEVDEVIRWLTGYSAPELARQIAQKKDFTAFFGQAPRLHPDAAKITGTICGVRIEAIEHPLMKKIRWLDKLVDELAKGRPMQKILRQEAAAAAPTKAKPTRKVPRSASKPARAGRSQRAR